MSRSFYPNGMNNSGSGGQQNSQNQSQFNGGAFNLLNMLSQGGQPQKSFSSNPNFVPYAKFDSRRGEIQDLRERKYDSTGELLPMHLDTASECICACVPKGSNDCLKLQRSTLMHIRGGDDPRKNHQRGRILSDLIHVDMSDAQFAVLACELKRIFIGLGLESKTVKQWIRDNVENVDDARRNLFEDGAARGRPGSVSDEDLLSEILQGQNVSGGVRPTPATVGGATASHSRSVTIPPGSAHISGSTIPRPFLEAPRAPDADATMHVIGTPTTGVSAALEAPESGNPAPRTRPRAD